MSATVRSLVKERVVLDQLESGPKTSREISRATFIESWNAWADRNGVERSDDPEPMARLLASVDAEKHGQLRLHPWEAYAVLRRLERKGSVHRLQLEGRKAILWSRSDAS